MTALGATYFKFGDVVSVHWYNFWTHGRVIGCVESISYKSQKWLYGEFQKGIFGHGFAVGPPDESCRYAVRVALNQPFDTRTIWRGRFLDSGTPVYQDFMPSLLRLDMHDPSWNTFAIEPYVSAEVHRDFGTYLSGANYREDDPVWVWEGNAWQAARVVKVDRWISVRYLRAFQDRKGHRSKSYRTWQVWPVVSETSSVLKKRFEELQLARKSYQSQVE